MSNDGRHADRLLEADVVVVGAGPGGTAAAITLARAGRQVVVVDKANFPRDKICGDGLTTGALRIMEHLGVRPEAISSWKPVHDIHVGGPSGHTVTFPLPRHRGEFAVVAERADVDHALLEQARKEGATVIEGASISAIVDSDDAVTATFTEPTADGPERAFDVRARYLIAADGMWSPTRKLLGTAEPGYLGEWHAFRQYFSDVGPKAADLWVWFEADLVPGYVWSFPLPDGRANVGFGIQRGGKVTTKEMKALWPEILSRPHIADVLGPIAIAEGRHQAWPIPARVDEVVLAKGRVLWVGDAAAATDPMTGEGIGQALLTGVEAARAVLAGAPAVGGASDPSPVLGSTPREAADVRHRYERAVHHELVADHKMSLLLVRALKHRKGARAAIRVAGLTPWTRRNFARWLFEDEPRAVVLTPRRWHRRFLRRDGAYANR
ncbi:MAG: geranylgeranyl reductase family protein [Acidimicrobiales bacterium]|nr:geranylgeranyl reductase family protein [Acidimicrobiales bacterium]